MNEWNCTLGIGTVPNSVVKHKYVNNNAFLCWGIVKHGVSQGSILNLLCILSAWVIA
jgi:hypothetical protein